MVLRLCISITVIMWLMYKGSPGDISLYAESYFLMVRRTEFAYREGGLHSDRTVPHTYTYNIEVLVILLFGLCLVFIVVLRTVTLSVV